MSKLCSRFDIITQLACASIRLRIEVYILKCRLVATILVAANAIDILELRLVVYSCFHPTILILLAIVSCTRGRGFGMEGLSRSNDGKMCNVSTYPGSPPASILLASVTSLDQTSNCHLRNPRTPQWTRPV